MDVCKVFVIVVTFKGKQWYDSCFQSLRESDLPVETIVVDNASNDGTVEYIKQNFPEIILIESKENLGFGRANNLGMRYALDHGCDYVFLLNQDAWIEPDTFEKLIAVHKEHEDFGIISPMHLTAEKNSIESALLGFLNDKSNTDGSFLNDLYFGRLKDWYETRYVNAAAWLLPRKTLETIGGFDPIFLHYGEDDNYMQRVLYHGLKIIICPESKIVHDSVCRLPSSFGKLKTNMKDELVKLTDINVNVDLKKEARNHFRKMFLKLLKGQKASFHYHKNFRRYILDNETKIVKSRNSNKKLGPTWL